MTKTATKVDDRLLALDYAIGLIILEGKKKGKRPIQISETLRNHLLERIVEIKADLQKK